jgi:hypothetical protein
MIVEGLNGGPTYSLLNRKLSAGGGGQLATVSRTTQDSLTITFGATCYAPEEPQKPLLSGVAVASQGDGYEHVTGQVQYHDYETTTEQANRPFNFDAQIPLSPALWAIALKKPGAINFNQTDTAPQQDDSDTVSNKAAAPKKPAADGSQNKAPPTFTLLNGRDAYGYIQWVGIVLPDHSYYLRGTITSSMTGETVGQIWVNTDMGGTVTVTHFPSRLDVALNDQHAPADYWKAIPACDAMTASQKQQSSEVVNSMNVLSRFLDR